MTTLNAFSNNTIDKEAAKRAFAQSLSLDAYFIPLINAVVDECYNSVNNNAAYKAVPVAPKPGRKACSFAPEGFLNCVKTKLFQVRRLELLLRAMYGNFSFIFFSFAQSQFGRKIQLVIA